MLLSFSIAELESKLLFIALRIWKDFATIFLFEEFSWKK